MEITYHHTMLYTGSICLFSVSLMELNKAIISCKHSVNRPLIAFNSSVFILSSLCLFKTSKEIYKAIK